MLTPTGRHINAKTTKHSTITSYLEDAVEEKSQPQETVLFQKLKKDRNPPSSPDYTGEGIG